MKSKARTGRKERNFLVDTSITGEPVKAIKLSTTFFTPRAPLAFERKPTQVSPADAMLGVFKDKQIKG